MLFLPTFLLFLGGLLLTPAPELVADILDTYTSAFWIAYVARPAPTAPAPVTSLSIYAPFALAPPPPPPPPKPAKLPFLAPAPVPLAFAHIAHCETAPGYISSPHEFPDLDAEAGKMVDAVALWMAVALVFVILGAARATSPSSKAAVVDEPVAVLSDEVPEFFIVAQRSAAEELVDLIYSSNETSPISSPVLDSVNSEQAVEDNIIDEIHTTDTENAHILATLLDTVWFHGLTDAADDDVDDERFIYPDSDFAAEDDYVPRVDADDEQFVYPGSDSAAEDDYAPEVLAGVASDEATSTTRRDEDEERCDDTADANASASADNEHGPGLEASIHAPQNKATLAMVQTAGSALPDANPSPDAPVLLPTPGIAATTPAATVPQAPTPPAARPEEPARGAALAELAHAYMPSCPQTSIWDQNATAGTPCTPPPSPPRAKTRRSRRKGKGARAAPDVVRDAAASPCAEPAELAIFASGRVMEDLESRPRAPHRRRDARSLSPSPTSARSAPRMPMAALALPAELYEREWGLDR